MSDEVVDENPPHTTLPGGIVLLCGTILGAGVLSIPFTFSLVGIGAGFIALIIICLFSMLTNYYMLKGAEKTLADSYEMLFDKAFPKVGKYVLTFFMLIEIFGVLSTYLVILINIIEQTIPLLAKGYFPWYTSEYILVLAFTFIFIFPLCLLKDISRLEIAASISVFLIIGFGIAVVYLGIKDIVDHLIKWPSLLYFKLDLNGVFNSIPIFALAFTCQMSIFPIRKELINPSLVRMNIISISATIVCAVSYSLVGFFGYIMYTTNTDGNVLKNLPTSIPFVVLRVAYIFAILFHYPVIHFAFRKSIQETFFSNYRFSWIRHSLITVLTLAGTLIWAVMVPSVEKIFTFTGAISAYPITFLFPVISYCKLFYLSSDDEVEALVVDKKKPYCLRFKWSMFRNWDFILAVIIFLFSIISMGISIYTSILQFLTKD